LHNSRINVQRLYSPLIAAALVHWGMSNITLIEDTSMLWDEYCLIRLSIQYRGHAIPRVWRVIRLERSSVRFDVYQSMLKRASRLISVGVSVCFLALPRLCRHDPDAVSAGRVEVAFSDSGQK